MVTQTYTVRFLSVINKIQTNSDKIQASSDKIQANADKDFGKNLLISSGKVMFTKFW